MDDSMGEEVTGYVVYICFAVCSFCGADINPGKDRHRGREFESGDSDQNSRCGSDGVGDGMFDPYAEWNIGDKQKKLDLPYIIRPGDGGVMDVLL